MTCQGELPSRQKLSARLMRAVHALWTLAYEANAGRVALALPTSWSYQLCQA